MFSLIVIAIFLILLPNDQSRITSLVHSQRLITVGQPGLKPLLHHNNHEQQLLMRNPVTMNMMLANNNNNNINFQAKKPEVTKQQYMLNKSQTKPTQTMFQQSNQPMSYPPINKTIPSMTLSLSVIRPQSAPQPYDPRQRFFNVKQVPQQRTQIIHHKDPFVSEASRQTLSTNMMLTKEQQPIIGMPHTVIHQQTNIDNKYRQQPNQRNINVRDLRLPPTGQFIQSNFRLLNKTIAPRTSMTMSQSRSSRLLLSPPYESQPTTNMQAIVDVQSGKMLSREVINPNDHQVAASSTDEIQSTNEVDPTSAEGPSSTDLIEQPLNGDQASGIIQSQQPQSEISAYTGSDLETMQELNEVPSEESFGYRKRTPGADAELKQQQEINQIQPSEDHSNGDGSYMEMHQLQEGSNNTDPIDQITHEEVNGSIEPQIDDEQYFQQMQPVYKESSDKQALNSQGIYPKNYTDNGSSTTNEYNNQESASILAAKLPSQYDTVLRIPPEGYYDDYFKPGQMQVSNQMQSQLASGDQSDKELIEMSNNQIEQQKKSDASRNSPISAYGDDMNNEDNQDSFDIDADRKQQLQQQLDSDNIKLIMADTTSSQNKNSSGVTDKIINYTSESREPGGNITRFEQANKSSPRLTFVNKDMNESIRMPGVDSPVSSESSTNPNELFNPLLMPRLSPSNRLNHRDDEPEDLRRQSNNNSMSDYEDSNMRRSQYDGSRGAHKSRANKNNLPPQVTEVDLDPQRLIMASPTKPPDLLAGGNPTKLMESLANIPKKMKKIQDQQPDKNELMNELLTALDRVKVAIYKLQPLTAKMNAIYRKSVASNTRDMVMDNNKGFYSKKYPPGDFDDSYDRIPTREFLRRRKDETAQKGGRMKRSLMKRSNLKNDDNLINSTGDMGPSIIVISSSPMNSQNSTNINSSNLTSSADTNNLKTDESQIVATGIGRRLLDGSVENRLQFKETSLNLIEDDDIRPSERLDEILLGNQNSNSASSSEAAQASTDNADVDDANVVNESPVFGYRITIFRPPASSQMDVDETNNDETIDNSSSSPIEYQANPISSDDADMLTSESSLIETRTGLTRSPGNETVDNVTDATNQDEDNADYLDGASSEKIKSTKKSKSKKKMAKEGAKKGEMKKKHEEAKKAEGVESKRKKEYKKIKHNKGVVSKEKKTMKRDKHIKAHDRGAAKEKALKERTQIEFFEREQIVDDEYEKGKKSTIKAGWQTGHDSKKTKKEGASLDGDSGHHNHQSGDMSMGGSHNVKHIMPLPSGDVKSVEHAKEQESSSGKKSNKFEKKHLESKGKKFKGWREKGYKIITETEFIDRGSLHDSAYKKRDKGAAQHQKYKKHEATSEGHHGSMHEHMKKSKKREEKRSKMAEKKGEKLKKVEKSKKKIEAAKKSKGHHEDHQTGASSESPSIAAAFLINNQTSDAVADKHQQIMTLVDAMHENGPASKRNNRPHTPAMVTNNNKNNSVSESAHLKAHGDYDLNSKQIIATNKSNSIHLDIVDNSTGRQVNKTKIGIYDIDDQIITNKLTNGTNQVVNRMPLNEKSAYRTARNTKTNLQQSIINASSEPLKSLSANEDIQKKQHSSEEMSNDNRYDSNNSTSKLGPPNIKPSNGDLRGDRQATAIEKLLEIIQTQQYQQHNRNQHQAQQNINIAQPKPPNIQQQSQQQQQQGNRLHKIELNQNQNRDYQKISDISQPNAYQQQPYLMNPNSILASAEIIQAQTNKNEMKSLGNVIPNNHDFINAFPSNYLFGINANDYAPSQSTFADMILQDNRFNQDNNPFMANIYQPQASIFDQLAANSAQNDNFFQSPQHLFQ